MRWTCCSNDSAGRRQAAGLWPVFAGSTNSRPIWASFRSPRYEVTDDAWAAGRTLADLDLRARTGALIIAIRRGDQSLPSPPPDTRIEPGDLLYLMGSAADITRAREGFQRSVPA